MSGMEFEVSGRDCSTAPRDLKSSNFGRVLFVFLGHGLIRLFIMLLLFRQSETKDAGDLHDRFYGLISNNIDVPKEMLVPLVEEYTSLYKEYFSLRGAGNYAKNYEAIPRTMTKIYGLDSDVERVPTESFPVHLHRYVVMVAKCGSPVYNLL
jgi:hypothetical protein